MEERTYVVRKTGRNWGVFMDDGVAVEPTLVEGGFFRKAAALEARQSWEDEDWRPSETCYDRDGGIIR